MELTQEIVRRLLRYEPETGKLFWKPRTPDMFAPEKWTPEAACKRWNSSWSEKEAFTYTDYFKSGKVRHKQGAIFGKLYYAHQIIWFLNYGFWAKQIDHIDGDAGNNKLENLREVTNKENQQNASRPKNNTSGYCGVSFHKQSGKFRAYLMVDYKQVNLGFFDTAEVANEAVLEARPKYGFHPNHGR